MSISGIEGIGSSAFTPFLPPQVDAPTGTTPGAASNGVTSPQGISGATGVDGGFGDMLVDGIERLESVQRKADTLSVQAATGQLENIHDYTIAATEAAVTTQMTVAVRNKAVEAFTEIMRMHVG